MPPAIEIESLTKKYGDVTAVSGLDLMVEQGELFGLLGPNGAGKTTTIRVCLGLLKKNGGNVRVLGMDSHVDTLKIRDRTGYLPGEFGLIPGIKVYDQLRYLLSLSNVRSDRKMKELAERLDLDLDKKTDQLSKGNKQKVGLVQALMADQDLIIMDEPTSGLDPLVQQEVYRIMEEEMKEGKTIFMSSHVLAEVETVCDKVAIIRKGKLVVEEKISTLQEKTGKILEVEFQNPVDPKEFEMPGVANIDTEDSRLTLTVHSNLDQVIKKVADHKILNMSLKTYSLEELFLSYYSGEEGK